MNAKILIIHASFGEGHKVAASALEEHLNATCKDFLDFCNPVLKRIYRAGYFFVTAKMPFFWGILFFLSKFKVISSFIAFSHRLLFVEFLNYLKATKPEIIISTHFFPPQLLAKIKKELNIKVICLVTDLGVHPLWKDENIDLYITPSMDTKIELIKLGVYENSIISGYVSLRQGFLQQQNTTILRQKFGFDEKPILLFASSSRGNIPFVYKVLPKLLEKFNILLIFGTNKKLKNYLDKINVSGLKYFPFYPAMWELVELSSVIVSKPGGLTVFEGCFKKKFFVFTHFIAGQEEENMNFLIKHGVAKYARNSLELIKAIDYFCALSKEPQTVYPLDFKDIRGIIDSLC